MLRKSLVLLPAVAGLVLLVAAGCFAADDKPDVAGTYAYQGTNPDGSAYKGTIKIAKKQDHYVLAWSGTSGDYVGIGIQEGNTLSAAWRSANGKELGIVVYKIKKGDKGPKLVGKYTDYPGNGSLYPETLTFVKK